MLHATHHPDPMYRVESDSEKMSYESTIEGLEQEVADLKHELDIAEAECQLLKEKRDALLDNVRDFFDMDDGCRSPRNNEPTDPG